MTATLNTGAILVDRANARIAREDEAFERWAEETQCMDCEYCNDSGWCDRYEIALSKADMEETIHEAGCFE